MLPLACSRWPVLAGRNTFCWLGMGEGVCGALWFEWMAALEGVDEGGGCGGCCCGPPYCGPGLECWCCSCCEL